MNKAHIFRVVKQIKESIGNEWFNPFRLVPEIRRPFVVCEKLRNTGALQRRYRGGGWQYRLVVEEVVTAQSSRYELIETETA